MILVCVCCFVGFPKNTFNIHFTDLRLFRSELGSEKKVGFSFRKLKKGKLRGRIFFKKSLQPSRVCIKLYWEREKERMFTRTRLLVMVSLVTGGGKNLKTTKGLEVQASAFTKMPTFLEKRFLRPENRGQCREPLLQPRNVWCFEGPKERASHPSVIL